VSVRAVPPAGRPRLQPGAQWARHLTEFGRAALGAGDAWFDTINTRLAECSLLLTLCTPESVYQPWINFEAGWAWGLEKPVVPVCHGGLMPDDLKMPFSSRQAVTLTRPDDLESLYNAVADARGSNQPRVAFARALERSGGQ
jgi:hypothetical protein